MPDPPEWHKSAAAGSGEKWRHLLQRFLLSDTLSVIPPRGSWGQNPFPLSPFCTAEGLGSASTQYGRPGHQNAALTSTYIHCQGERPPWVIGGSCDQISLTEGRGGVRGKKTPEQICDSALFFEGLKTGRGFRPPQVTVRHLGLRCVPYSTESVSLTLPCSALLSPHTFFPRSRSQSVSKKVRRGLSLPLPPLSPSRLSPLPPGCAIRAAHK